MFKIGMTDRLSLYIIILFYSCTIFVGYNFLDKANNQTISKTNNNKRLVHLVLMKFKKEITSQQFQKITDGAYGLQEIPGVEQLNFKQNISPEGLVFRCCWTGGHYYDQGDKRFYYPPKFERMFNGFHVPIEKILSYDYWNKLQNYLKGYERSFKLCKNQCGKIVSSIEKEEQNLKTGERTYFDAYNQNGN